MRYNLPKFTQPFLTSIIFCCNLALIILLVCLRLVFSMKHIKGKILSNLWPKYMKSIYREFVAGSAIQAAGTMELEDGLRTARSPP